MTLWMTMTFNRIERPLVGYIGENNPWNMQTLRESHWASENVKGTSAGFARVIKANNSRIAIMFSFPKHKKIITITAIQVNEKR